MKDAILIKGNKYGLTIIINDMFDIRTIQEALYKKLNDSRKFFGSSKVSLSFEGKALTAEEQKTLIEIVQNASDLDIICIMDSTQDISPVVEKEQTTNLQEMENTNKHSNENESSNKHSNEMESTNSKKNKYEIEVKSSKRPVSKSSKNSNDSSVMEVIPESAAIFHKGTLRSGQEIIANSSIIIMGNVHNGASVSAKGNVIVIGKLNGCVHAGKDGNETSFVVALNMSPTQLRIADVFGRSPDKKSKIISIPQIAYVEDERIIIENINRNIYENLNFINN
ncbi:MAG: septum site-determining protein MinC [Firmicutes bacterium HGW-Firmicutes-1]|jgi:septum site-determining protein MinC|nr:MAG: septum site-determining protein MinC [Firmicutes bacterium HGW-Firmicutes-1]